MKKISDEKRKEISRDYFRGFMEDTEEPRAYTKPNSKDQFIAVGKLKIATNHFNKDVNVATVRTVHCNTNTNIPELTKWDCTIVDLKIFRNCCNRVLRNWKR